MRIWKNGYSREMTEEEINAYNKSTEISAEHKILLLKQKLKDTDYKAIKYAEGLISNEEYLPIKNERQAWRNEINELEGRA